MFCKQKLKNTNTYNTYNTLVSLCSSTTEIMNIPHQSIYFMGGFTFEHFHATWYQKVVHTYTIQQLKDAGLSFATTHHERANKIHVHGYPLDCTRDY